MAETKRDFIYTTHRKKDNNKNDNTTYKMSM